MRNRFIDVDDATAREVMRQTILRHAPMNLAPGATNATRLGDTTIAFRRAATRLSVQVEITQCSACGSWRYVAVVLTAYIRLLKRGPELTFGKTWCRGVWEEDLGVPHRYFDASQDDVPEELTRLLQQAIESERYFATPKLLAAVQELFPKEIAVNVDHVLDRGEAVIDILELILEFARGPRVAMLLSAALWLSRARPDHVSFVLRWAEDKAAEQGTDADDAWAQLGGAPRQLEEMREFARREAPVDGGAALEGAMICAGLLEAGEPRKRTLPVVEALHHYLKVKGGL